MQRAYSTAPDKIWALETWEDEGGATLHRLPVDSSASTRTARTPYRAGWARRIKQNLSNQVDRGGVQQPIPGR